MKHHNLKILPQYFREVVVGTKTFEIRKNDRGFMPGDVITLNEWTPELGYTHNAISFKIGFILPLDQFCGADKDMVAFSLVHLKHNSDLESRIDEIVKYCKPHQEMMWAKYITGIALAKSDWRD